MRRFILFALFAVGSAAALLECEVDLAKEGLPFCFQNCSNWCWATSLAVVRDFYYKNRSADCRLDECAMVSTALHADCCRADACSSFECNVGMEVSRIVDLARENIPLMKWDTAAKPLDEEALVKMLRMHTPVLRTVGDPKVGSNHIDVVVGCRKSQEDPGKIEYEIMDSLSYEPGQFFWLDYNRTLCPGCAFGMQVWWLESIWSPSFAERWQKQKHLR